MAVQTPHQKRYDPPNNLLRFHTIAELNSLKPSEKGVLLEDFKLCKGDVCLLVGAPGTGKSRAAFALAVAGVKGGSWMGIQVRTPFRTLVVQTENGLLRLNREAKAHAKSDFSDKIMISEPPLSGISFDDADFVDALQYALKFHRPDLVVVDPWNAVSTGDTRDKVVSTIDSLHKIVGYGDASPAILLVHHVRKNSASKKSTGRALLQEVAGSYALGGHARSVFVLEPKSNSTEEVAVRFTCAKNNNGTLGPSSYWQYRDGGYEKLDEGDFIEDKDPTLEIELAVVNALESGATTKKDLVEHLTVQKVAGRTKLYKLIAQLEASGKVVKGLDKRIQLVDSTPPAYHSN